MGSLAGTLFYVAHTIGVDKNDKEIIRIDDVTSVVGMSKQYNIFELQKAIGRRNAARSIEIMERMLNAGESPISMIVMLSRYFQKLWVVQELRSTHTPNFQLASALGVSPFFLEEYYAASSNYQDEMFAQCFVALTEADEALKSSSTDPKLIMTILIYRCVRSARTAVVA